MYPCNKCLENNWKYQYDDGLIIATCLNCENEISFEAKKQKGAKAKFLAGDKCRKCGFPLVYKPSKFRKRKLKLSYYYQGYHKCLKCNTVYYSDQYKVFNKELIN